MARKAYLKKSRLTDERTFTTHEGMDQGVLTASFIENCAKNIKDEAGLS